MFPTALHVASSRLSQWQRPRICSVKSGTMDVLGLTWVCPAPSLSTKGATLNLKPERGEVISLPAPVPWDLVPPPFSVPSYGHSSFPHTAHEEATLSGRNVPQQAPETGLLAGCCPEPPPCSLHQCSQEPGSGPGGSFLPPALLAQHRGCDPAARQLLSLYKQALEI